MCTHKKGVSLAHHSPLSSHTTKQAALHSFAVFDAASTTTYSTTSAATAAAAADKQEMGGDTTTTSSTPTTNDGSIPPPSPTTTAPPKPLGVALRFAPPSLPTPNTPGAGAGGGAGPWWRFWDRSGANGGGGGGKGGGKRGKRKGACVVVFRLRVSRGVCITVSQFIHESIPPISKTKHKTPHTTKTKQAPQPPDPPYSSPPPNSTAPSSSSPSTHPLLPLLPLPNRASTTGGSGQRKRKRERW